MQRIDHVLALSTPGAQLTVTRWHFGMLGARPKVFIQAALHADELPGVLVAHEIKQKLEVLEQAGLLRGEVILVPVANPIGLAQFQNSTQHGRFDGQTGRNFNRGFPDLVDAVAALIESQLTNSAENNLHIIRDALSCALQQLTVNSQLEALQCHLFDLALDADLVLDLHCDSEADLHLYAHREQLPIVQVLGAYLGVAAILYADEQGGQSFDDALTRQWYQLKKRFPSYPIPVGCTAVTVELRGQSDVNIKMALADADAIIKFISWHSSPSANKVEALHTVQQKSTPLNFTEILASPISGIVSYTISYGVEVSPGTCLAVIVNPISGETLELITQSGGIYYARNASRYVAAGTEVCFVAGDSIQRNTDNLLSS
ncbi:succinylglutamate desuccinylase/aspartoacylase family protein [Leeia aquatica]|uniref:Succinylglutamate desuccinylase/aspartoacylase family protein n=1 Tax=Leeia aquatica TaxID=2725557 RepID=A0A847SAA6_9NEIS|nr:succinylglutamate desuccinylase/aspartoacylase family protein [Leeia aquatica]NLR76663.1 succinylglutamate desuccinylase/aspartoacylase family protein [Leeia aquatica]